VNEKLVHWLKASIIVLGWSITPVVGKYVVDITEQATAYQLSFFRYLIAAVILYIILMFQKKVSNRDIFISVKKNWWKYIIISIFCALMPVLLFLAVNNTTASTASFLLNANIVILPIMSFFIIKERITKRYLIALIFALIGLFFVIFDENILNLTNLPFGTVGGNLLALGSGISWASNAILPFGTVGGNLLALGSGISWALYTIFLKKFFSKDNPLMVTFISLLMGSVFLSFFAFLIPPVEMSFNILGIFLLFAMAIIGTSFAYSLWLDILSYLSTTETGILQVLVPIVSVTWSVIFLEEGKKLTYFFGIGAVLIIVSILIFEIGREKLLLQDGNQEK